MNEPASPTRHPKPAENGEPSEPANGENSDVGWIDPASADDFQNLTIGDLERLARETGLPVETLRRAGSFYADSVRENKEYSVVQVCDGTSCRLCGGKAVETILHRYGHESQRVYCLGFCDRSPISMIPRARTCGGNPTSIRNVAPEAILTKRILGGPIPEIENAINAGVYAGLIRALELSPIHLIEEVEKSGERVRDGSGTPTGTKWRTAAESTADQRFVIANGDEGEPGAFLDRILMERDPHTIIEGMILCGYAIGASEGIIYIRSEYPQAVEVMHAAIAEARKKGYLGENICGSGFSFDIRVFIGKGSYLCGNESALVASLEGLVGGLQHRPGNPSLLGLHGKPTVVNNVETLSNIPFIALKGGQAYAFYGTHATSGTKAICLNHGFQHPGLVEVEFGITFREVIEVIGGGGRDGEKLTAVLVGGPMGSILKPEDWDYPICHEVLDRHDIQLGNGGFIAIPESADFRDLLVHLTEFMVRESCGDCVNCRVGSQAFLKAVEENRPIPELKLMLDAIEADSQSPIGQFVPDPIRTLLTDFSDRIFAGE
jgi:NADH:ubiquinone oxidoreductase subunit F (NADH-binding)